MLPAEYIIVDASLGALVVRGGSLWPVALGMVLLAALALTRFYIPQTRGAPRRWQWILPILRGSALIALAASIVRPVISSTRSIDDEGAVLVLIDRSASMSATDRILTDEKTQRGAILGHLVALADELGRLPEGTRSRALTGIYQDSKRLESLADDISRARREFDYARLSGRDPRQAQERLDRLLAEFASTARSAEKNASSMRVPSELRRQLANLPQIRREDRQWTEKLREAVAKAGQDVLAWQAAVDEELYLSNEYVRKACDELSEMSRLELAWEVVASGRRPLVDRVGGLQGFAVGDGVTRLDLHSAEPNRPPPIDADARQADLMDGIRRAVAQQGADVRAVVLFTDGRQSESAAASAGVALTGGAPLYAIDVTSPRVRDLAVASIELPQSVFVGERLTARVGVRNLNYHGAAAPAGEAVLSVGGINAPPRALPAERDALFAMEFSAPIETPGVKRVVVNLPYQNAEASAANNSVERWTKAISQKIKVLLVTASPNWDFRAVRNLLARTPQVELREAVIGSAWSLAVSEEEILEQDLVILSDVSPDMASWEQWQALLALVRQRGGSVLIVPGDGHSMDDFDAYELLELVPYVSKPVWRAWPGESAFYRAVPSSEAEAIGALRLADDAVTSRRRWEQLPGIYRYFSIPSLKPMARKLLVERQSNDALLTEMRVGAGRAFFLATSETWRWRKGTGATEHERFWTQLVRYAIDEPYMMTSGRLSLDVENVIVQPGEAIRVRAKLRPGRDGSLPAKLDLLVYRGEELLRSLTIPPAASFRDGRYRVSINDLPQGDFELSVAEPVEAGFGSELRIPVRVEPRGQGEMANLSGDSQFLRQLAEGTGGRMLPLERIGALPSLLAEGTTQRTRTIELPLWHGTHLYLFVLGCLSLEWALRKRLGMA